MKLINILFISCSLLIMSTRNVLAQENNKTDAIELIVANVAAEGSELLLRFTKGKSHNHPSFAVWAEDMEGNFIQTLFVTKSIASGLYTYGELEKGVWGKEPGEASRPSALPYFMHKRQAALELEQLLPTPENPIADAYTGATPKADFTLDVKADKNLKRPIRILLEVNQPWDWNKFWYNDKFPNEPDYLYSCQPSVVYAVGIDAEALMPEYVLNPIGHGHYSGKDGILYTDMTTITTALDIYKRVAVEFVD